MTKWHGGKGSATRKGSDSEKFESNWERIFGKKTLVELLDDECRECGSLSKHKMSCSEGAKEKYDTK